MRFEGIFAGIWSTSAVCGYDSVTANQPPLLTPLHLGPRYKVSHRTILSRPTINNRQSKENFLFSMRSSYWEMRLRICWVSCFRKEGFMLIVFWIIDEEKGTLTLNRSELTNNEWIKNISISVIACHLNRVGFHFLDKCFIKNVWL